jgi:hypothetical protein
MPGIYNLANNALTMQPYVDIEGSGESTTTIPSTQIQLQLRRVEQQWHTEHDGCHSQGAEGGQHQLRGHQQRLLSNHAERHGCSFRGNDQHRRVELRLGLADRKELLLFRNNE